MIIENKTYDQEREFYNSCGVTLKNCRFDGPADGESAFKESREIVTENCYFNLRYPFWHDRYVTIKDSELTSNCRAAMWYTAHADISNTKMHGIKAVRESRKINIKNCDIISPEFGWMSSDLNITDTTAQGEYFLLRAEDVYLKNVTLTGKYSFQYVKHAVIENCVLNTKDAFWHAEHVTVRDSVINGEYLGWYSDELTLINCKIKGTQPLCYCKELKMENCEMYDADLCFEKSDVEATITTPVISVKNPSSGSIVLPTACKVIRDSRDSHCEIIIK